MARPRGGSTAVTTHESSSPRRMRRPEARPTSATPYSSLSKRSRGSSRLAGRKPSKTSPKRTNSPAPMSPVTTPSNVRCQPSRRRRSRSRKARQIASARRSASAASRSRCEQRSATSGSSRAFGASSPSAGQRAGRAVHHDVGIAPDRRREVHVGRRGQRGVPAVDRVVARDLERAQQQRAEGLAGGRPLTQDRLEQLGLARHCARGRGPSARSGSGATGRPSAVRRSASASNASCCG